MVSHILFPMFIFQRNFDSHVSGNPGHRNQETSFFITEDFLEFYYQIFNIKAMNKSEKTQ